MKEFDIDLFADLWMKRSMSVEELGRLFGFGAGKARRTAKSLNLPRRKTGPVSEERHGSWKQGIVHDKSGYVLVRMVDHPHANSNGYIRQHRLVMEQHIGRHLEANEVVHHKNGVRDDNRLENLELYENNAKHLGVDLKGRCPKWTEEGRQRMREASDRKKIVISDDIDLHDLYWTKSMTTEDIAAIFDCSTSRILREFRSRGIPIKSRSQSHSSLSMPSDNVLREMLSKDSTPVVAGRLGVKVGSLYAYLERHGIPTSRRQGIFPEQSRLGYSPTNRMPKEPCDP